MPQIEAWNVLLLTVHGLIGTVVVPGGMLQHVPFAHISTLQLVVFVIVSLQSCAADAAPGQKSVISEQVMAISNK